MADFKGMTVQVTLKHPPGVVLHGKVKELVAGQALTLQDVYFPATGARWENWVVQSTAIHDLGVIETAPTLTQPAAVPANFNTYSHAQAPRPLVSSQSNIGQPQHTSLPPKAAAQVQPISFVDPAILSFGKSPAQSSTQDGVGKEMDMASGGKSGGRAADHAVRTVQDQSVEVNVAGTQVDGLQGDTGTKKKARRGQKKKSAQPTDQPAPVVHAPPPVMNAEVSRNGNDMDGGVRRGKGWRQGPFLQPSPQNLSPAESQGTTKQTKNRKQRREEAERQQNGWATEDATDIQGLGDFDFEANHKLFDKKQVFEELRQGDTTADEDRLVSHNKVHRPGTYGGKNLHPTENVLSPPLPPKNGSNELEISSDADTELNLANGRSSSRVSLSQSTVLPPNKHRQSSLKLDAKSPAIGGLSSSDRGLARSATSLSIASRGRQKLASVVTSSPHPARTRSPQSAVSTVRQKAHLSAVAREPHFTVLRTMANCPVLHPMALETLEMETISQYGLTQEAITESAARCVAEIAMGMFDGVEGSRRVSRSNTARGSITSSVKFDRASVPVVVILVGNHIAGARAVAAARQIVCHNTQVIVAEAQYEATNAQDTSMKSQTSILKRMMKAGAAIKRGSWKKAFSYIKNLPGPPAVIIDALLAGSIYQSLSATNAPSAPEHQQEVREMIEWANRSRAPVLSIACPSGVSGVDGHAPVVEGEPLAVRPDRVLSLGVPMSGLLEAMKNGERWDVSLADIGINIALRSEEAVAFGAQWVAELNFLEADTTV